MPRAADAELHTPSLSIIIKGFCRESSMSKKSREFFYRDKDGEPQDSDLHEPILSGGSREAEARVREIGKTHARKAGLTEDEINRLYADPNEAREQ